jgi:hypothetical protein
MAVGAEGTWLAQAYEASTSKQTRQSLGALDHLPAHQRFDAAKKLAEAWFEHLGRGGSTKVITVKTACENYVYRLRESGDTKNSNEAIAAADNRTVHLTNLMMQQKCEIPR